jgi:hypothetical protein
MQRSSTPFPLLRTFLASSYRTSRFLILNYLLTLIGTAITVYSFGQDVLLGTVSLALSFVSVVVTVGVWYRAVRGYYVRPLAEVNVRKAKVSVPLLESGYEILPRRGYPGDALLTSALVNSALFNGASSALEIRKTTFRAKHPSTINYLLLQEFMQRKNKVLFNGKKIRLRSDPLLASDTSLRPTGIQPTHYFDTLTTNDALAVSVRVAGENSKVFDGNDFCFPANTIPGCNESRCANQFGTSTIAFTSDSYLVIVGQSATNAFSQRLWAPSGSGSADWKDVHGFTELQDLVKYSAKRELVEETGLSSNEVAWIRAIGYGRLLHRGGLPQFFCLAQLNCTLDKVRITRSERPLVDYHTQLHYKPQTSHRETVHALMRELRKNERMLSSALWWCLELLSHLPERDLDNAFSRTAT